MCFKSTCTTRSGTSAGTDKNLSHWPDTCPKFAALGIDQGIWVAKENHVCFSCLKPAGREHRVDNCKRRQKCTKTDNGRKCMQFHHLLHYKSTAFNIGMHVASLSLPPSFASDNLQDLRTEWIPKTKQHSS